MKVTEAEKATTEDSSSFTWKIHNFSKVDTEKLYSDYFTAGGHKWNVLIFPKGNNVSDHLSIYLNAADAATLPDGWPRPVKCSLSLINQVDESNNVKKEYEHTFNASECDWGFTSFMPLCKLGAPDGGYVVEDTCIVRVEVVCDEQEKDQQLNTKEKEKEEEKEKEKASLNVDRALVEAEKTSSSVNEFDALLSEIQTLLGDKASDIAGSSTNEDILRAKTTFQDYATTKIATIFQSGRASELKKSLSTMLMANAFSENAAHEAVKFLAKYERYLSAWKDLQEAERKESSVNELRTGLKQLVLELVPIKNGVNEVDREVAELERKVAESNAKKARLRDSLGDLAARVTVSREAMTDAEQDVKLFEDRKERAEAMVADMESLWESLKKD